MEAARSCSEAKQLFKDASEVVQRDLLKLCDEGPEQELHQTEWAQPALLTASMAAVAKWRQHTNADVSAGPRYSSACVPPSSLGVPRLSSIFPLKAQVFVSKLSGRTSGFSMLC